jgi:hypothetical protein
MTCKTDKEFNERKKTHISQEKMRVFVRSDDVHTNKPPSKLDVRMEKKHTLHVFA